jgi:regulator of nucleoside diphosphate kinase
MIWSSFLLTNKKRQERKVMTERTLYISKNDMEQLLELIDGLRSVPKANQANLDLLEKELYKSVQVEPADVPHDVVTMNSKVAVTDTESGEKMTYTLVYPSAANISENKLSILAPLGIALLGYRKGDVVEWSVPSGIKKYIIDDITYQPEASGDYHL